MTIWKTNPLNLILVSTLTSWAVPVNAGTAFDCLKDLLPITSRGEAKIKRNGFEAPFVKGAFLVFPEGTFGRTTGFYVYKGDGAWFYDSVVDAVAPKGRRPIGDLEDGKLYELIAQPEALETLAVPYRPEMASKKKAYRAPEAAPDKTIIRLHATEEKSADELRVPLKKELEARRAWLHRQNLDEETFKKFSELLKGSCKYMGADG
jgi:hypothetical protein